MHLRLAFERTALAFPSTPAIVEGPTALTYADWLREIRDVAGGLVRRLRPGDRVLCVAGNGWRHATLFWAAQFAGAVSVHVDPRLKREELLYYLADAEPTLVFAAADVPPGRAEVISLDDDTAWQALADPHVPVPEPDEGALSHMVYTSGTTGPPKGVPLTHRQSYERGLATALLTGVYAGDRVLGVMPMFHQMGLVGSLMVSSLVGATYHAVARFVPGAVLDLIERERITTFFGSPTHYALLAAELAAAPRDLGSFRKPIYGGGPMSATQLELWQRLTASEITHLYGTTETMCTLINRASARKPGAAGRPGLHHRLRLVVPGARDPEARVGPGEEGELIVEVGANGGPDECFSGYWRKPEQSRDAIVEGWYFTGDSATIDADGDYFITGRLKNLIRSGAESIHPEEVERVLQAHEEIADAAVFGLPDAVWGEVVAALIVARRPLAAADIESFCRAHRELADFKRPRRIAFVQAIPRNVTGKLVRSGALALMAESGGAATTG